MEILKRRITLSVGIALVFIAGAVAYALGYHMAMKKFNEVVEYSQEKEKMYSKLSEVDKAIRQEYIGDIDEAKLISGLCSGYVTGLGNPLLKYLPPDEYKKYISKKIYDDNAVFYENINNEIGYIKINSVIPETGNMFYNAIKSLYGNNIKKVIIDIRNLYSMDLDAIGKCLDSVTEKGALIGTIDKKGNKNTVYKTNSDRMDVEVAVIMNSETEGTPELIAAALKDSGNGKLVGEKTKGHAVWQKAIALSDGSGIIYPAAYYVSPKGDILEDGLVPDIFIELDSEKKELLKRGELKIEDDAQIQEAIKSFG